MKHYLFSAYGLSVTHPENWKIYINPHKTFSINDGFVKIDKQSNDKKEQVSFAISWETSESDEYFAERYSETIKNQFKGVLKDKNRFEFYKNEIIQFQKHKACYVYTKYVPNTNFYRKASRSEQLEVMQLAYYCEISNKIIVGTITASQNHMRENYDELEKMLFSIKCHDQQDGE